MAGGMCGRGACMVGRMHGRGACVTGGVHGGRACVAGGACMAGGHVWQEGMRGMHAPPPDTMRYGQ